MQTFRTKIFLTTADPDTARFCIGNLRQSRQDEDQLQRLGIKQQCPGGLAERADVIQQGKRIGLQALPEI